jgi:predicted amidohydrolase
MMKVDITITGGRVIDPAANVDKVCNVYIQGKQIVSLPDGDVAEAAITINADGCIVVPGLIDFHTHFFANGTEWGVNADTSFLPIGVTTAVEAGSAGSSNYDCFAKMNVCMNRMRTFSFLNVSPGGLPTALYAENINPSVFDKGRIADLMAQYRGQLIGLKIRQSKEIAGNLGLKPLESTLEIAETLGCPVVVHTSDPAGTCEELANMLRPGDIYCHVFSHRGNTIMDGNGKVKEAIRKARQRGVLFDSANARFHFYFPLVAAALDEGFPPDIISTDLTTVTTYAQFVYGLPFVMMQFMGLGMPLTRIIEACTVTPAEILGQQDRLGTLRPGARADVAIFLLHKRRMLINDYYGEPLQLDYSLAPQMTILDGKVVYRHIEFQ